MFTYKEQAMRLSLNAPLPPNPLCPFCAIQFATDVAKPSFNIWHSSCESIKINPRPYTLHKENIRNILFRCILIAHINLHCQVSSHLSSYSNKIAENERALQDRRITTTPLKWFSKIRTNSIPWWYCHVHSSMRLTSNVKGVTSLLDDPFQGDP